MDVTPLVSKDRQLIESYGDGSFKISGVVYSSPVVVFPELCIPLSNFDVAESKICFLKAVFQTTYMPSILLFGAGKNPYLLTEIERDFVRQQNCVLDVMNTGAACRTFNVLCAEDRQVAAALIPVA